MGAAEAAPPVALARDLFGQGVMQCLGGTPADTGSRDEVGIFAILDGVMLHDVDFPN